MTTNHRIFTTSFASVYPLYVAKAEKKGRKTSEVDAVICWLPGCRQRLGVRWLATAFRLPDACENTPATGGDSASRKRPLRRAHSKTLARSATPRGVTIPQAA